MLGLYENIGPIRFEITDGVETVTTILGTAHIPFGIILETINAIKMLNGTKCVFDVTVTPEFRFTCQNGRQSLVIFDLNYVFQDFTVISQTIKKLQARWDQLP